MYAIRTRNVKDSRSPNSSGTDSSYHTYKYVSIVPIAVRIDQNRTSIRNSSMSTYKLIMGKVQYHQISERAKGSRN